MTDDIRFDPSLLFIWNPNGLSMCYRSDAYWMWFEVFNKLLEEQIVNLNGWGAQCWHWSKIVGKATWLMDQLLSVEIRDENKLSRTNLVVLVIFLLEMRDWQWQGRHYNPHQSKRIFYYQWWYPLSMIPTSIEVPLYSTCSHCISFCNIIGHVIPFQDSIKCQAFHSLTLLTILK